MSVKLILGLLSWVIAYLEKQADAHGTKADILKEKAFDYEVRSFQARDEQRKVRQLANNVKKCVK